MPPKPPACPVCKRPTAPDHRPFCSRGCQDRDLLNWLGDGYRIPGPSIVEEGLDSTAEEG